LKDKFSHRIALRIEVLKSILKIEKSTPYKEQRPNFISIEDPC
jgi:hypothetical protein